MRITNEGRKTIENVSVSLKNGLPFAHLTTNGVKNILPLRNGLSIRDENSHALVSVYFNPAVNVAEGNYSDELIITSDNAGSVTIPISAYVGAANQGTIVLELRNDKQTPLAGREIVLTGPTDSNAQVQSRRISAVTSDGSGLEGGVLATSTARAP